jgi:vanillate O-demethylase ferredoxin subunit
MASEPLQLRVRSVTYEAEDINGYELVDPKGGELPPFTAGAHIDVHVSDGLIRQYSLSNDPRERHRYVIGVLYEPGGRGGSKAMHETIHAGAFLTTSAPRNNFPLAGRARHHLLLAGGIGVTPMMAMVADLGQRRSRFTLHYCTRSAEKTAFADRLADLVADGHVVIHHDGGDPSKGLDIEALLADHESGTHLYYCGPTGFMQAAETAAAGWPKGSVHFEYFSVPDEPPSPAADSGAAVDAFQVKLASNGTVFDIPPDKSIVDVLRDHGIEVDTSCESGLCGTCQTKYLEGEPEHHDLVLDEDEQQEYVMICCARSKSPLIVLDL